MQTVLIVIHLMVVLAMIGVVLLQKSEGGGLGMGGGGGSGFLSSRGTANVLTRTTAILAAIFFSTSLILSILAGIDRKPTSIFGGSGAPATGQPQPGGQAPAAPGGGGSLLDQFQGQPAQPAAPQAPRSQ
jgi:preprotein translocase subunit SecG